MARIKASFGGSPVAYTEPVPGYLLAAAGLDNLAPAAFTRAIEDGTEPTPQAVAAMLALMTGKQVKVLLYNSQAVSPITTRIRSAAGKAGIPVIGVTETLPPKLTFQQWQLAQARAALRAALKRVDRRPPVVSVQRARAALRRARALERPRLRARRRASCSRCSARTGPARRRCSASCSGCSSRRRAASRSAAARRARAARGSATSRSSASSTATCRCAAATSSGSVSTDTAGESAASRTDERARIDRALTEVGAAAYADAPVGRLSGGEQQRLRVAQALVSDPALLLADEPLLSLDLSYQRIITSLFDAHRRRAGTPVVFVTHDINPVLSIVDRVLYLAPGSWAIGTPDEVLTSETLSRLYDTEIDVLRVRGRVVVVGTPDDQHVHHVDEVHA